MTYTAQPNQTLFSIVLDAYGSMDALDIFLADNPQVNLEKPYITPGDEFTVREDVRSQQGSEPATVEFWNSRRYTPAHTAIACEGIGCWIVEDTFIVT